MNFLQPMRPFKQFSSYLPPPKTFFQLWACNYFGRPHLPEIALTKHAID